MHPRTENSIASCKTSYNVLHCRTENSRHTGFPCLIIQYHAKLASWNLVWPQKNNIAKILVEKLNFQKGDPAFEYSTLPGQPSM